MPSIDLLRYHSLFGVSLLSWSVFLGVVVVGTVLLRLVQWVVVGRLQKLASASETDLDDMVASLAAETRTFFFAAVSLFIAIGLAELPEGWESVVRKVVLIAALIQAGMWGKGVVRWLVDERLRKMSADDPAAATGAGLLRLAGVVVVWAVVLMLILSNLGYDITTLVAGLGVGGIAIALAVQNLLGDLFASISILLDKPFVVGDFVVVDEFKGTVEKIGLKTTHLRSLGGEQLVFSNADLLKSRLRNYKRMFERRVVFRVGVCYHTPVDRLQRIPGWIEEIVQAQPSTRFDRCHFAAYGDFALEFETVYFVLHPDYKVYMDVHQAVNLAIFRRFAEHGIEFAFPTRTIHVAGLDRHVAHLRSSPGSSTPANVTEKV